MRRALTALVLALTGLAALPLAAAAPAEDHAWRLDRREVTAAALPDSAILTSRRDSALGQDELTATLDGARARLEVRMDAEQPDAASAGLTLDWRWLVEYRDADGDGRYGLADAEVQRVAVASLPHSVVAAPLVSGGQSATATYALPRNATDPVPLPGAGGSLVLTVALVPAPTTLSGQAVDPTEAFVSAEVRGFPYAAGDTRLALVGGASSDGPVRAEAGGVGRSSGPLAVAAAWLPVAHADGADRPAASTAAVAGGGGSADVVQSWPRGDQVSQAGAVSVQRWRDVAAAIGELRGDWRFYALGVAAVGAAFGVPSALRLRKE
jgi:hypothetical protein